MVGKYLQVIELKGFENKRALLAAGTLHVNCQSTTTLCRIIEHSNNKLESFF